MSGSVRSSSVVRCPLFYLTLGLHGKKGAVIQIAFVAYAGNDFALFNLVYFFVFLTIGPYRHTVLFCAAPRVPSDHICQVGISVDDDPMFWILKTSGLF